MAVVAKFVLESYTTTLNARYPRGNDGKVDYHAQPHQEEMRTLKFRPVSGDDNPNSENSRFWDASPAGMLELGVVNPEAWKMFELGESYYLTFNKADN